MITLLALAAFAQSPDEIPAVATQYYRIPVDARRTMWAEDTELRPSGYMTARAGLGYMQAPFGYWAPGEDKAVNLVEHALSLDLIGGFTAGPVRIGVDLPVNLVSTSDEASSVSGLGDMAFDLRATLVERGDGLPGLGVGARAVLPTATKSANPALGSPGFGAEMHGAIDYELGDVLLVANLGFRLQPRTELPNTVIDDQVFLRTGAGYALDEDSGVSLDLAASANFAGIDAASVPIEAMVGGYHRLSRDWMLRGGISRGLTRGIGSPVVRLVVVIAFEPAEVRDLDGDGILDVADACVKIPEDLDGVQDLDGCPEGVVNVWVVDEAGNPIEATWQFGEDDPRPVPLEGDSVIQPVGAYVVRVRSPGYGPVTLDVDVLADIDVDLEVVLSAAKVSIETETIDIRESVYFDTGKATIQPVSYPLLDEVATMLVDHPELLKVRIEGHTDSRGSDAFNLQLSKDRTKAVLEYLVARGVERPRLESEGYGESRPLDPRETPEAWEKNRRVDFFVVARDDDGDGKPDGAAPAPTPPPRMAPPPVPVPDSEPDSDSGVAPAPASAPKDQVEGEDEAENHDEAENENEVESEVENEVESEDESEVENEPGPALESASESESQPDSDESDPGESDPDEPAPDTGTSDPE